MPRRAGKQEATMSGTTINNGLVKALAADDQNLPSDVLKCVLRFLNQLTTQLSVVEHAGLTDLIFFWSFQGKKVFDGELKALKSRKGLTFSQTTWNFWFDTKWMVLWWVWFGFGYNYWHKSLIMFGAFLLEALIMSANFSWLLWDWKCF